MNLRAMARVVQFAGHAMAGMAIGIATAYRQRTPGKRLDRSLAFAAVSAYLSRRLGGVFPKFAQILSTRYDLLSDDAIRLLSTSCSRLELSPALSGNYAWPNMDPESSIKPLGGGAIAETFLIVDGNESQFVAKRRRPGISVVLATDLAIVRIGATVANRLGLFRSLNLIDNVRLLSDLMMCQLDPEIERQNLVLLRNNLHSSARVPEVLAGSSADEILMEYLPHRRALKDISSSERPRLAVDLMHVIYRMIFIDGFVHCDLHPGNIYLGDDGAIVIIDAGFCSDIDDDVRMNFREFFLAIGLKRAQILADIILRYSSGLRDTGQIRRSLHKHCRDLIDKHSGMPSGDFRLIEFIKDLYEIYRTHGLTMTSDFFSIIYALLIIEGTVTKLDPHLDFQALAIEFMVAHRVEIYPPHAAKRRQASSRFSNGSESVLGTCSGSVANF